MTRGPKHEPTQRGNPWQLTINQHVHSRWCIDKFADERGRVAVLRRGQRAFNTSPENAIFCAQRAWSEQLERGQFAKIERAFHAVVTSVLDGGTVSDHQAVTSYVVIWQLRSDLARTPPSDVTLVGIDSSGLDKDREEILEKKGYVFARGSTVPGRFGAHVQTMRAYDMATHTLAGTRWGILAARGEAAFLCPSSPKGQLYVPLSPTRALVAGCNDRHADAAEVTAINRGAARDADFVFGLPLDIARFAEET